MGDIADPLCSHRQRSVLPSLPWVSLNSGDDPMAATASGLRRPSNQDKPDAGSMIIPEIRSASAFVIATRSPIELHPKDLHFPDREAL
jgi:hypothetical protein